MGTPSRLLVVCQPEQRAFIPIIGLPCRKVDLESQYIGLILQQKAAFGPPKFVIQTRNPGSSEVLPIGNSDGLFSRRFRF